MSAPSLSSKQATGGSSRSRLSDPWFGALISAPGVLALLALLVVPVALLFGLAFMEYTPPLVQKFIGWSNFSDVLGDRLFWVATENSFIYGVGVTVITLIGGLALGLSLSKITRGSLVFRTIGLIPWAVPLVVSALIWKWFLDPQVGAFDQILTGLGLSDHGVAVLGGPHSALVGVIVADAWTRIPFLSIFVLAGVEGINGQIYEAARVDGAGAFSTFWNITLPLIRRPLLTGLLIVSMFSFRALETVYVMTHGGPARGTYTLAYYIADQLWLKNDFGTGAATGVLLLIMIGAFALVYVHFINKSPEDLS